MQTVNMSFMPFQLLITDRSDTLMNPDISQLVEEYSDMVFRLILRIVVNRDDALDLTQELIIKLYEKPAYLRNVDNPKAYVLKTAYNQALNYRRNQFRRKVKEQSLYHVERQPVSNPEDELVRTERAQIFKEYLNELSPQQRDAVLCRFYGEMKLDEIAGQLKINEATVRVHLKRAFEKIRGMIMARQEG